MQDCRTKSVWKGTRNQKNQVCFWVQYTQVPYTVRANNQSFDPMSLCWSTTYLTQHCFVFRPPCWWLRKKSKKNLGLLSPSEENHVKCRKKGKDTKERPASIKGKSEKNWSPSMFVWKPSDIKKIRANKSLWTTSGRILGKGTWYRYKTHGLW